jgi:phenylalanyl-tRNA synthetase beta chain
MATLPMLPCTEMLRPIAAVRQVMVQRDYQEVINYAFVEEDTERNLCNNPHPVKLVNPISSQMSVMRSSLLGGLLTTLCTNLARKHPRVRVFEIGTCFANNDQQERLSGLCFGSPFNEQWGVSARNVDFFDIKCDVEALFFPSVLNFIALPHSASHPGKSAQIQLDGKAIGWLGELHPQWLQHYDIPKEVAWFEVEMDALLQVRLPRAQEVSKFPPVRRDLAVLVDEVISVQVLISAMMAEKVPNVVEVALFDVYRGNGVEFGKKSLAFRVLLQDTQKTLTENEIEENIARLISVLQHHGAQLRG